MLQIVTHCRFPVAAIFPKDDSTTLARLDCLFLAGLVLPVVNTLPRFFRPFVDRRRRGNLDVKK